MSDTGRRPKKRANRPIDNREACYYCGGLLRGGWGAAERDHFPIPEQCGGTKTVPVCQSCHDMKDRFEFGSWSFEWLQKGEMHCRAAGAPAMAFLVAMTARMEEVSETRVCWSGAAEVCMACGGSAAAVSDSPEPSLFDPEKWIAGFPLCLACRGLVRRFMARPLPQDLVGEIAEVISQFDREAKLYWAKILSIGIPILAGKNLSLEND